MTPHLGVECKLQCIVVQSKHVPVQGYTVLSVSGIHLELDVII